MNNNDNHSDEVEWRSVPIAPYHNYDVSSDGRVRRGNRELVGYICRNGYRRVLLSHAGRSKIFTIHRLVCEAFHGPAPGGDFQVRHLDGVRLNCHPSNLEWGTHADNVRDTMRHGTHARGEKHPRAKLNWAIVEEARQRHSRGESGRSLAREFGVSSGNMSAAIRGESWARPDEIIGRKA